MAIRERINYTDRGQGETTLLFLPRWAADHTAFDPPDRAGYSGACEAPLTGFDFCQAQDIPGPPGRAVAAQRRPLAARARRAGADRRRATNREIAHELFLSPRTVEMQVSKLLAKLDCRSRAEAIHEAHALGLAE